MKTTWERIASIQRPGRYFFRNYSAACSVTLVGTSRWDIHDDLGGFRGLSLNTAAEGRAIVDREQQKKEPRQVSFGEVREALADVLAVLSDCGYIPEGVNGVKLGKAQHLLKRIEDFRK